MGIQGLLPLLKSIMLPFHIKELEGCCVAVDTYSWLHKGALSCSIELCKGLPTTKHIDYCMHRVNLLRHYGIKPILVFDGGPLPMKLEQENKRARSRRENLTRAMEHEANGNMKAAYECYQKAVDISPLVAYDLIQVLKQENVSYLVAPYEADAQLTFLAISKQVEAVITEDSDLIAFGCPRIIYKMDKFGQGVQFRSSMLQQNKEINLTGFTQQMLLEMCILSGCDYLQSLPGMGLKKAHALVKKFKTFDKVIKHLKYNSIEVTPLYEECFKRAILTFQHQRVYDTVTDDIVHLSKPSGHDDDSLDFVGPWMPQHVAKAIAQGDLDPFTKEPIQKELGSAEKVLTGAYDLNNFKPEGERKKLELPAQKNLLTNYFCFASLEAKRKFSAPRTTLKNPNADLIMSSPVVGPDAVARKTNSPICLPESKNLAALSAPRYSANVDTPDYLEPLDLGLCNEKLADNTEVKPYHLPENSVYKPCITLQKGHSTDLQDGEMRAENKNVIVRSSYFPLKSIEENDKENKENDKPCITLHKEHSPDLEDGKMRAENNNVIIRSSYFSPKSIEENDKENKIALNENGSNRFEDIISNHLYKSASGSTGHFEKSGKVIRSSYFQQNTKKGINCTMEKTTLKEIAMCTLQSDTMKDNVRMDADKVKEKHAYFHNNLVVENDEDVSCEELERGDDIESKTCDEHTMLRSSSYNDYSEATMKRRKVAQGGTQMVDMDNNILKSVTGSSVLEEETEPEEGKFGCTISHLDNYSDIAEKSMEKFVSVISSFKFTSTGSRASGLRPPLKDIKNTRKTSSKPNLDPSIFAYAPTKQKAPSRCHKI